MADLLPPVLPNHHDARVSSPETTDDFGIVIACCDQDYLFAKGCCASIRHFLGNVPILLIVDGTFSVTPLERAYGVKSLYRKDVADPVLRRRSFGVGLTKMIAFWECPWRRFLFLDADTIVFGNILADLRFSGEDASGDDLVIDQFGHDHTDEDLDRFFFDTRRIRDFLPELDWQRHRADFFCTGVFAARRDAFSLEEYVAMLDLQAHNPGLFFIGEQGFLNAMIFAGADAGRLRVRSEDIQLVTSGIPRAALAERFPISAGGPVASDARVLHWAGSKPLPGRTALYPEPMTFFRRKFLRDAYGLTGLRVDLVLRLEDAWHHALVAKNRLRRLVKKRLGQTGARG